MCVRVILAIVMVVSERCECKKKRTHRNGLYYEWGMKETILGSQRRNLRTRRVGVRNDFQEFGAASPFLVAQLLLLFVLPVSSLLRSPRALLSRTAASTYCTRRIERARPCLAACGSVSARNADPT